MKILRNKYFKWINIIAIAILFTIKTLIELLIISGQVDENKFSFLLNKWIWIGISAYIVFILAFSYFSFYRKLFINKKIHMDLLIALAIHISFFFSLIVVSIDADYKIIIEPIGILYVFEKISKSIENKIASKSTKEKKTLESLKEKQVMLKNHSMISVENVKIGDVVMVHKDEIIQFDGVVESMSGLIDTSNINGESEYYEVKPGSNITSGTKLISNMINIRVTKTFENSMLNKIIKRIDRASNVKPKMQLISDKIYNWFIPSAILVSLITFIIWISIGYALNINPLTTSMSNPTYRAFFISISVLAISCPCAMSMTTPLVSYFTAQYYWKNNIVFNDHSKIEYIDKVTCVVFDKTGTITSQKMTIIQEFGDKKYHSISASLEEHVYHPMAMTIFKKYNKELSMTNISNVNSGVQGQYKNDKYLITKVSALEINAKFKKKVKDGSYAGLFKNGVLVAAYVMEAELKKNVLELFSFLKRNKKKIIILSGDNEEATSLIAKKINVEYKANQTPENKADYVKKLREQGEVVMMIGDGLNDAIAFSESDVSLSFATGSDIANSYSSASLLSNDLKNIIFLFKLSKKSKTYYLIALFCATIFNILLIPIAAFGLVYPWAAASAMYISNFVLYFVIFIYTKRLKSLEKKVFGKTNQQKAHSNKKIEDTSAHMNHCH